jgi:glycosyltransferase involved in cell wall biosynthesis
VVATDAGSLPEILGQAAPLVPVGDVDGLAGALATALGLDGEARAAVLAAGRAHAAAYTWERCAGGMADLYRRVAGA